ncbi:MAG: hypothetical protein WC657_05610 [Candidatus Paceibacterota bacterium]|jgi:hypothetical protein
MAIRILNAKGASMRSIKNKRMIEREEKMALRKDTGRYVKAELEKIDSLIRKAVHDGRFTARYEMNLTGNSNTNIRYELSDVLQVRLVRLGYSVEKTSFGGFDIYWDSVHQ